MGYEDSKTDIAWSEEYTLMIGASAVDSLPPIYPGTDLVDYGMVSFVQWPDDPLAASVFGIVCDPDNFKIGSYDPITEGYIDCGNGLEIEPGRAYWVLARDGLNVSYSGIPVSLFTDIYVSLSYNESTGNGWNQIGCPNASNYNWDDVEVRTFNELNEAVWVPISDLSDDNDYIDKQLWRWDNGSYFSDTTLMEPYEGYWVRVKQANVSIRFPESAQASVSKTGVMFASFINKGQRWLEKWVFSPSEAIAVSSDSPPLPMASLSVYSLDASGGSGSGGNCFIATATYGSAMGPHVKVLRDFRERFLLSNSLGKAFVNLYYTYSPPMAEFIAKHANLKAMVRVALLPVVGASWVALKLGPATTATLMLLFIIGLIGMISLRREKVKT